MHRYAGSSDVGDLSTAVVESASLVGRYEWTYVAPTIEALDLVLLPARQLPNWIAIPRGCVADDEEWRALCRVLARLTASPVSAPARTA